ncbi:MAG: hypothetical protein V1789_04020 [PVC group bacterium]
MKMEGGLAWNLPGISVMEYARNVPVGLMKELRRFQRRMDLSPSSFPCRRGGNGGGGFMSRRGGERNKQNGPSGPGRKDNVKRSAMAAVMMMFFGVMCLPAVIFGRFVHDGYPMDWEGKLNNLLNPGNWHVAHQYYDDFTFEVEEIHMRVLRNGNLAILFKCGEIIGPDTLEAIDEFSEEYAGEEGGWFFGSSQLRHMTFVVDVQGEGESEYEISFNYIFYSEINGGEWDGTWREAVLPLELAQNGALEMGISFEGYSPDFDPITFGWTTDNIFFEWENTGISELIQGQDGKTGK